MESIKKISKEEKAAVEYLVSKARLDLPLGWSDSLYVKHLDDGRMGSFIIIPNGELNSDSRRFGSEASEYEFIDEDGVTVIVSLYLDENGKAFEIDVWKTDYSPIVRLKIPE